MSRILIEEAKKQASGQVSLAGFVHNLRQHKSVAFLDLRDLSGQIQVVIEEGSPAFLQLKNLSLESVVAVAGRLQPKMAKKGQENSLPDYELLADNLQVLSAADENLPISVLNKVDNLARQELRFNWRWLDLRQPEHQLIFKVWTKFEEAWRQEFLRQNFIQIYSPSLMSTASESGAEVFAVKYFDRQAYLAQSPQFYKQMAMASGLEKVFTIGPVFRAEASFTNRHLTEFIGWDFEVSYIDSHLEVMAIEEKLIIAGFEKLVTDLDLKLEIPTAPFPRLTLADAKKKLLAAGVSGDKKFDLSPEEEREICRLIKEETGHDFVFITDYPIAARPFYHMRYTDQPEITKSFDLLYRGIEVTTGSQREHRVDVLIKQATEKGINLEEIADYLNFFRYGCPPHGGAGIGPGRLIMKILNYDNIKEVCFLPRDVRRLKP